MGRFSDWMRDRAEAAGAAPLVDALARQMGVIGPSAASPGAFGGAGVGQGGADRFAEFVATPGQDRVTNLLASSGMAGDPYLTVMARHADTADKSAKRVRDIILRGQIDQIPAALKDFYIDMGLGTAFGVTGELGQQGGKDIVSLALVRSSDDPEVRRIAEARGMREARAYLDAGMDDRTRTLVTIAEFAADPTFIPAMAVSGGMAGFAKAGTKAPTALRAANAVLNTPGEMLFAPLGALATKASRARGAVPTVAPEELRGFLEEGQARRFKELGDTILPLDRAGGGVQASLPLEGLKVRPQATPITPFPPLPEAARQGNLPGQGSRQLGFPEPLAREMVPAGQAGEGLGIAADNPVAPEAAQALADPPTASPLGEPSHLAKMGAIYGVGQPRRQAERAIAKRTGAKVDTKTGRWSYQGRDVTAEVYRYLDERVGLKGNNVIGARLDRLAQEIKAPATTVEAPPTDAPANLKAFMAGAHPAVLNTDGTPKVLYHGTGSDFDTFRPGQRGAYGKGIYFTDSPEAASEYAMERADAGGRARKNLSGGRNANIKPVYLSLRNPVAYEDIPDDVLEPLYAAVDDDVWHPSVMEGITAWAKAQGYDGIVARSDNHREYIAFEPGQIKSAIGNRGTYDPADPRIQHAVSPTGRMLLTHPEVLTTAIGGAGGALVGGGTDPDGGADGYLGGALAGALAGNAIGRVPGSSFADLARLGHQEGARAFREAWREGKVAPSLVATDFKRNVIETPRGLALDELSNRVRALINDLPQREINRSYASLAKRWKEGNKTFYGDDTEALLASVGIDPAAFDWPTKVGQGYLSAQTQSEQQLHPFAAALAGAGYALANPATAAVPVLGVAAGAARGVAREYTSGLYRTLNDASQYAARDAAFRQEAGAMLERAAVAFKGLLRGVGHDPKLLPDDGRFAPMLAERVAPGAGLAWRAILDQVFGTPAVRRGGEEVAPAFDGLAAGAVKGMFGDYSKRTGFVKAIESVAIFARYNLGQLPVLAAAAKKHPAVALALGRYLRRDKEQAEREGRPGYQVGTVRVDTETPLVGRLLRAQLGGGEGEGRINPTASALSISGAQLGATDKFEEADTPYTVAEAVLAIAGLQPNPVLAHVAFLAGGDLGSDRAPSALSRTSGIDQALPGPQMPTTRETLNRIRGAMGNKPDTYDPVDLRAKEMIYAQTGKPASDPSNRGYWEQLLDPNSPLMVEAARQLREGGAVKNAVSIGSPITVQTNTAEKVAYRQAKVDQAGQVKATGAAAMYQQPRYAPGSVRDGKKVDVRLRNWESTNSTLRRLAPTTYAKYRAQFIKDNKIRE